MEVKRLKSCCTKGSVKGCLTRQCSLCAKCPRCFNWTSIVMVWSDWQFTNRTRKSLGSPEAYCKANPASVHLM